MRSENNIIQKIKKKECLEYFVSGKINFEYLLNI